MRTLITSLLLLFSIKAFSESYYRITFEAGEKTKSLSGKSSKSLSELKSLVTRDGFIELTDLFYYRNNELVPWKEWNENLKSSAHIRASKVIIIYEYDGNPYTNKSRSKS